MSRRAARLGAVVQPSSHGSVRRTSHGPLRGTPRLVRLALRRDRVLLAAWTAAVAALAAGIARSIVGLYPTSEERVAAAAFSASNPVLRAFDGPSAGPDIGSLVLMEGYWLIAVLIGLAAAQSVVRHTRLDEETGRAELIGAAAVGRQARLAAALVVASIGTLLTSTAVMLAFVAVGLPAAGVLLTGATLTGNGVVFAAVAALAAQLATTARTANASAGAVLGGAFVLRAVGDAAGRVTDDGLRVISAWPSWLSPIGWGQQAAPFADERWAVLGLFATTATVVVGLAVAFGMHRDMGGGLLAARAGPARASRWLSSPLGLAWRSQRTVLAGWVVAITVLGAAFGAVGERADELLAMSDDLARALAAVGAEGDVIGTYIAFTIGFLVIAAAAFGVQAVLRFRTEELAGRAEPVLATATARHRLLGAHAVVALGGTAAVAAALGGAAALGYGVISGDWGRAPGFLSAAVVHLPAAAALVAVTVFAVATMPRASAAVGWSVLLASLVGGQFGALFGWPEWVLDVSPFTHVPALPVAAMAWGSTFVLMGVVGILVTSAMVGFRRRDLVTAS